MTDKERVDEKVQQVEDKVQTQAALLKWVLGGVAVGLIAIGGFAQLAFNTFMARSDKDAEYLRMDLKNSLDAQTKVLERVVEGQRRGDENQQAMIRLFENNQRTVEAQTIILRDIEKGQRQGVWRNNEQPPARPPNP